MIYLKRMGTFLVVGGIIIAIFVFIGFIVTVVNALYGAWGLLGITIIAIIIFAIIDVKIDNHLERKQREAKAERKRMMDEMFKL